MELEIFSKMLETLHKTRANRRMPSFLSPPNFSTRGHFIDCLAQSSLLPDGVTSVDNLINYKVIPHYAKCVE